MKVKKRKTWSSFFYIFLFLFILYEFSFPVIQSYCLNNYGNETIGYISTEEFYVANNNVARAFTNGYIFNVNGNTYSGNSHKQNMRIGEAIYIEFVPFLPYFNRVSLKNH